MENNLKYKKIIILGGSCSGKSTLANRIGLHTGYPVYHLDAILLDSNWQKKNKEKWEEICRQFLIKDIGIIDGNYTSVLPSRVKWADLIIFIDTKTSVLLYRNILRFIKIKFRLEKRKGALKKSKNSIRFSHLIWVLNWNKKSKNKVFSILKPIKDKKVLIIKEPRKLDLNKLLK